MNQTNPDFRSIVSGQYQSRPVSGPNSLTRSPVRASIHHQPADRGCVRRGSHQFRCVGVGEGLRQRVEAVLSRQGRYQSVRDNLCVKEVRLNDEAGKRWIICHNPYEAERDQAQRDAALARVADELERIDTPRPHPAGRWEPGHEGTPTVWAERAPRYRTRSAPDRSGPR